VVELLAAGADTQVAGKHVVVLGRSLVVGRPLAAMLARPGDGGNATVTLCHSRTPDVAAHCRRADVLVVAVGRRHLVTPDWVAPGAVVVDVGTHPVEGPEGWTLTGDVHPDVAAVAGQLTPVPGGVGPVTNAVLMRHVAAACHPDAFAPAW
jgi:methylenetetrahydrofolate dehydrogenase (NADP+)/methenyltetrahydrofolate cyclohydrolase